MATLTFTPTSTATATGRDWNNPANWTGGTVPTAADTAVVATPADAAPVITGGSVDTVGSLTLSAPTAGTATTSNLFIGGADYIGTVAPASAGAGTLNVTGTITDTAGFLAVNTGSRLTAGDIDLGALADLGGGGTIAAAGSIVNAGVILANAADVSLATPPCPQRGRDHGRGLDRGPLRLDLGPGDNDGEHADRACGRGRGGNSGSRHACP
jgi:hypothetical protein